MKIGQRSCLVLGGRGFLGINLCRRLAARGHHVRAYGHRGFFPDALAGVDYRDGEFSDAGALAAALDGMEVAFHLIHSTVPQSAERDIVGDVRENLLPSLAFLDLAREAGVRRVVFLSSGGTIYGCAQQLPTDETAVTEPITAYGISKLTIEKYLALYDGMFGIEHRILRVGNPFGPFQVSAKKQGLIAETIFRALRGEPLVVWGDGSVVRDFIYVDDVVDALELTIDHSGDGRVFNIGGGVGRSVREVLATIEQSLGRRLEVTWENGRAIDVPTSVLSTSRAREELNWKPRVTFEDGIARTIEWWRDNLQIVSSVLRPPSPQQLVANRAH
jgi:UDP-glucose 4-epimerase